MIKIQQAEIAKVVEMATENIRRNASLAAKAAAYKMKAHLVAKVDKMGITDRGIYKNSFRVDVGGFGATVLNDAPHAPIIEDGCRPHPVSEAGVAAIAAWAKRKLGVKSDEQAMQIARSIAWKIRHHGQPPKNVMRDELPKAIVFFRGEFERIMKGGTP